MNIDREGCEAARGGKAMNRAYKALLVSVALIGFLAPHADAARGQRSRHNSNPARGSNISPRYVNSLDKRTWSNAQIRNYNRLQTYQYAPDSKHGKRSEKRYQYRYQGPGLKKGTLGYRRYENNIGFNRNENPIPYSSNTNDYSNEELIRYNQYRARNNNARHTPSEWDAIARGSYRPGDYSGRSLRHRAPRHLHNYYYYSPYYGYVRSPGLYIHYGGKHGYLTFFFGSPSCILGYGCSCPYCRRVSIYHDYISAAGYNVDYATTARENFSYGFGGLNDDERDFWDDYKDQVDPQGKDEYLFDLRFGDEGARIAAAEKLAANPSEKALKLLKGSVLNDASDEMRMASAKALGSGGDESVMKTLLFVAKYDKSIKVRVAAIKALERIDPDISISVKQD